MMKNNLLFILIIFLSTHSIYGQSFSIPKEHYYYQVKVYVARVIDGDTFVLSDSTQVRLLGVGAPELNKKSIEDSLFADSAAQYLKRLIDGNTIKLTFDKKLYDFFGKLLAYAWLNDIHNKDSLFVQAELLKSGFARIFYYPKKMKYYYIFQNLKRTARRKRLGIWGIGRY